MTGKLTNGPEHPAPSALVLGQLNPDKDVEHGDVLVEGAGRTEKLCVGAPSAKGAVQLVESGCGLACQTASKWSQDCLAEVPELECSKSPRHNGS